MRLSLKPASITRPTPARRLKRMNGRVDNSSASGASAAVGGATTIRASRVMVRHARLTLGGGGSVITAASSSPPATRRASGLGQAAFNDDLHTGVKRAQRDERLWQDPNAGTGDHPEPKPPAQFGRRGRAQPVIEHHDLTRPLG